MTTDTSENHSRTLCAKQKVKCKNKDDCKKMCMDVNEMDCVKLNNNKTVEYIFSFVRNTVSLKNNIDNSLNSLTQITLPVKDKDNKIVLFNTISDSKFIYVNFKPSDTVNYNTNFVCYSIENSKINDTNMVIDISFFKNLTTTKNIFQDQNIDIKIINIDTESGEGVCIQENITKLPDCDTTKGGMLVWSGWTEPEAEMEWQCICNYPAFASGEGCSKVNSNVCIGGTFEWEKNQITGEAIGM